MIKEVRTYWCDGQPQDEDIQKGLDIAKTDKCIVNIRWTVHWSGVFTVSMNEESTVEEVKEQLPKGYPV